MDFGALLKRLREARGLTAYALAKRAGLSRQLVSQLEHGQRPSWAAVQALAQALGLDLGDLADLADPAIAAVEYTPERRGRPPLTSPEEHSHDETSQA